MAKLIHTMVRVLDLERSIEFYKTAFDLEPKHRLDFPSFVLVYLGNDEIGCELELTLNKDNTEPYTHGSGYGHVAFSVENLEQEHKKITDAGYQPTDIKQLNSADGTKLARFFFVTDPDGYKIEVLERYGHYI